ncbi:MAG: NAD(P)H-hydrate dehydratase, partial [Deltaproteobacteria bacterium]|nr:NAD(P)H-hydrate dehydratase [Deltaproteobacteria bacterium]
MTYQNNSRQLELPLHLLRRLAGADEMRAMDSHAIEKLGVPGRVLMENAAHHVARIVAERMEEVLGASGDEPGREELADLPVVVCCGTGNNGGDGFAAARLLANRGFNVTVVAATPAEGMGTGDSAANARAWENFGETIVWDDDPGEAEQALEGAAVLVDALFGSGLRRDIGGRYADMLAAFNGSPAPVKVAVDIPSGVDTDTGVVLGTAARCTDTVTFQVGKPGLALYPGAELAGRVSVTDISIPELWPEDRPAAYRMTLPFAAAVIPGRPADGHKGTFGHLLGICGSAGMGGAALLAGRGALKSGCGLVTMGVPLVLRDTFLADAPELMTLSAPAARGAEFFGGDDAGFFLEQAQNRDALALGCGLGRHEDTRDFVKEMVARVEAPLVIDADGLFHLSPEDLAARGAPTVITPHPGELARLGGLSREDIARDRLGVARRFAAQWGVVLVLKGAGTVVAAPDGTAFINSTGDNGLASGGTGDVLTGLLGGLLAQGLEPLRAALLGVYLHGLARDVCAAGATRGEDCGCGCHD